MGVFTASAPGKLFIAGEYAIVTPGEPAILVAVNRFITVQLEESKNLTPQEHSPHVASAIQTVEELCRERNIPRKQFSVQIHSELESSDQKKLGLGSSGAVTVAIIKALDQLYELSLTKYELFQLALLSIVALSPAASGGDIAASTYGGWLLYHSPDRASLQRVRESQGVTEAMIAPGWDSCVIQPLRAPTGMHLLVGWVGTPAVTDDLVQHISNQTALQHFSETELLPRNRDIIAGLLSHMSEWSTQCDNEIRNARTLLNELAHVTHTTIETPTLQKLCDIAEQYGASAKTSGAGGGDCAIAFVTKDVNTDAILRDWNDQNITDLQLSVHTFKGDQNER